MKYARKDNNGTLQQKMDEVNGSNIQILDLFLMNSKHR